MAAPVNYTGGFYRENFDTGVPPAGFAAGFTQNTGVTPEALPTGWFALKTDGVTPSSVATVVADTGSSSAEAFYNYGLNGNPDRALGSLAGSGFQHSFGLELINATGFIRQQIEIGFDAEIWRTSVADEVLTLQYLVSATQLTTAAQLANAVSFTSIAVPQTNWTGADASTKTVPLTRVTLNTPWQAGQYLYLRWSDPSSGDKGIGLDNVVFQAIPETSTWVAAAMLLGYVGFARYRRREAAAFAA